MFTISQDSVDKTVRIFDNFYSTQLVVNASDYDVVFSFFKGVTENTKIASNYTGLLFRIAQEGGYNVMSLMDILKGVDNNLQLTQVWRIISTLSRLKHHYMVLVYYPSQMRQFRET